MWEPSDVYQVDAEQTWAQRLDKERNMQAAQDSAEARYRGLFGGLRAKQDIGRAEGKKYMMGIPWSGMPKVLGGGMRDPATAGSYRDELARAASDSSDHEYMDAAEKDRAKDL